MKNLDSKSYDIAIKRYNGLLKRSYEKAINDLFFEYYSNDAQVSHIPRPSDLDNYSKRSQRVACQIKKLFDDMKEVRKYNKTQKQWNEEYLKPANKHLFKHFKDLFEKELPLQIFKEDIFGADSNNRSCGYCSINESEITELIANSAIYTKRIYSRGKTMEIDQIDAFAGYSRSNIILSCYWCNNAKTDEFSYSDFLPIAESIKKVWSSRLELIRKNKLSA
jgi:hypothetical protein